MNVKQGDLAILTSGFNEGRIVEVLRPWDGVSPIDGRTWMTGGFVGPFWIVQSAGSPLESRDGRVFFEVPAPDSILRPVSGMPVEEYDQLMDREPA